MLYSIFTNFHYGHMLSVTQEQRPQVLTEITRGGRTARYWTHRGDYEADTHVAAAMMHLNERYPRDVFAFGRTREVRIWEVTPHVISINGGPGFISYSDKLVTRLPTITPNEEQKRCLRNLRHIQVRSDSRCTTVQLENGTVWLQEIRKEGKAQYYTLFVNGMWNHGLFESYDTRRNEVSPSIPQTLIGTGL